MRGRSVLFALALIIAEFGGLCLASSIQFNGPTGAWSTAGLWSPPRVPLPSDTVLVPAGTAVDVATPIDFTSLEVLGTLTIQSDQTLPGALTISPGGSLVLQGAALNGTGIDLSGGDLHLEGAARIDLVLGRGGTITLSSRATLSSLALSDAETAVYGPPTLAVGTLNISSTGALGSTAEDLNASLTVDRLHWQDGAIAQRLTVASLGTMDSGRHGLTSELTLGPSCVMHWESGSIDATYGAVVRVEGKVICGAGLDSCYFDGDTSLPQPQLVVTGTVDASAASYFEQGGSVFLYAFEVVSAGRWVGGVFSSTRTSWEVRSGSGFDPVYPVTLNGLPTDNFDVFGAMEFGSLNVRGHSVALTGMASFGSLYVSSLVYSVGDVIVKDLFVSGTMLSSSGKVSVEVSFDVQGTFSNTTMIFGKTAVGTLHGTPQWINGTTITNEGYWTWNSSGYTFIDNTSEIINMGTIAFASTDLFQVLPGVDYSGGDIINYGKIVLPSSGVSVVVHDPVSFLQCDGSIEFHLAEATTPPYIQLSSSSAIGGGSVSFQLDTAQTWNSVPESGIVVIMLANGTSAGPGDVLTPIKWEFSSGSGRLCMGSDGMVRLFQNQKAPLATQNCDIKALDGRSYCPVRHSSAVALLPFHVLLFSFLLFLTLF